MAAGESARARARELHAEADRIRSEAENWEAGALGEERVAGVLAEMDTHSTRVLHDRLLNPLHSKTNLDHLAVTPTGIYLIDAKNWIGDVTVYNDSLWQHWTSADGRRSESRAREVDQIRRMAEEVGKPAGRAVTPVLCLAADQQERFGEPTEVRGVHVVPLRRLRVWMEERPEVMTAEEVATRSVQLSCRFPPATGGGFTMSSLQKTPTVRRLQKTPAVRRRAARRRRAGKPLEFVAGVIGLLVLAAVLPKIIASGVPHTQRAAPGGVSRSTTSALPAARAQALDDWRIRAGLYAANDQPAALTYTPDAALGSLSDSCRMQQVNVKPFRPGLLKAPDPQLAAAAKRFDAAATRLLKACAANHPVALHHARSAMASAASDVNTRYNRLIGKDPSSIYATRVL